MFFAVEQKSWSTGVHTENLPSLHNTQHFASHSVICMYSGVKRKKTSGTNPRSQELEIFMRDIEANLGKSQTGNKTRNISGQITQ